MRAGKPFGNRTDRRPADVPDDLQSRNKPVAPLYIIRIYNIVAREKRIPRDSGVTGSPRARRLSTAAAARRTMSRTARRFFPRRGVYGSRIIALRFAAAIGTEHFIEVRFHELFELFTALHAFVLQNRHFPSPFLSFSPTLLLYARRSFFASVFLPFPPPL